MRTPDYYGSRIKELRPLLVAATALFILAVERCLHDAMQHISNYSFHHRLPKVQKLRNCSDENDTVSSTTQHGRTSFPRSP